MVASASTMNGGRSAGVVPRRHGRGSSRRAWIVGWLCVVADPRCCRRTPRSALHGPGRPNILLILTDDQRAEGTMDVLPQTRSVVRDRRHEVHAGLRDHPGLLPVALVDLLGRYVHNHGVRSNELSQSLDQRFTIQEYLKQSGYRTGYFGKYLNAWNLFRNPTSYDDWSITVAGYSPIRVNENGVVKTISQYATSLLQGQRGAVHQRSPRRRTRRPGSCRSSTTAPHAPFTPEPHYANASVPAVQPAARTTSRRTSATSPCAIAEPERRPGVDRGRAGAASCAR